MASVAERADALWRATTYLAVAQLHLADNPLLGRPLEMTDVKLRATGHWGTVPGTAWALIHVGLAAAACPEAEIVPILGAGHAGIVQLALSWMTGDLAKVRADFATDSEGLAALVSAFPDVVGLGSEVHPELPAGSYVGGWLGGALAFAQGATLECPDRVAVPILGDGEIETPTASAAWLAHRSLPRSQVLPVVHLNGYRMGGPSLLGGMSDQQLRQWAIGLGWEPVITHVVHGTESEHHIFHKALRDGIRATRRGKPTVILMRCVKGWSGPIPGHKTPLDDLARDPHQRVLLRRWLHAYRPAELFDADARPIGALAEAVDTIRLCGLTSRALPAPSVAPASESTFSAEVAAVLRAYAAAGKFKVFSPDELASNRLGDIVGEAWVHEVLAEELLAGWLAGWTMSGRRGLLISYEAFSSLMLTSLIGQLKQRRLVEAARPSLNILLTSYGWHNVYTHGDPSLITALLGTGDPAVKVYTPADARRTAVALDDALQSAGRLNLIIAGKHRLTTHPTDTIIEERTHGLATWPHLSNNGEPDLVLVCAGDLPASLVGDVVSRIRSASRCSLRVVNVHELTALSTPALDKALGPRAPVLMATLGHPAAIWGVLRGRLRRPVRVIGWREPPHPMPQEELAAFAGMDAASLTTAALEMLHERVDADGR